MPGDDARYVLEQCGEPTLTFNVTGWAHDPSGYVFRSSVARADRWRYHRGPGKFTAVVVIGDNGRVEDIEFETTRD
jgi:hypothetical protein